jgi:hypothetical protein
MCNATLQFKHSNPVVPQTPGTLTFDDLAIRPLSLTYQVGNCSSICFTLVITCLAFATKHSTLSFSFVPSFAFPGAVFADPPPLEP